jgi:hypothetical protein
MSTLLFRLHGVTDDEADEVRQLLQDNALDYYETAAGRWGIGVAAIWLVDDAEQDQARSLLDEYQQHRLLRVRRLQDQAKQLGLEQSLWRRLQQAPGRVLAIIIATLLVLYFSIWPFLQIGA